MEKVRHEKLPFDVILRLQCPNLSASIGTGRH